MYQPQNDDGFKDVLDKIAMKTLVHGDKTLMVEFRLGKGADLPSHSHPHEQTGFLISGRIKLTIGKEAYFVEPGGSWCISGGVEHKAVALEDSAAIEVFSPIRDDYLPKNEHGKR